MTCLPSWHTTIARASKETIKSGCVVNTEGNVPCSPESMRAKAEAWLNQKGYRKGDLSLATYTLARYIGSEVGSGSPEDKVGVAEAAVNQSKGNVVALLLYRQAEGHPNRGWYGPVKYNRWAATSRDPTVADVLVADLVLSGRSGNFTGGASDQWGPDAAEKPYDLPAYAATKSHLYWVGPLPGVDWWRTYLVKKLPNVAPSSAEGQKRIQEAVAALRSGRPDWSKTPVCLVSQRTGGNLVFATALLGLVGVFGFARYRDKTKRGE